MMDLQADIKPDGGDTPPEALDAPSGVPGEPDGASERDWDAEARAMGWRPPEEFKGDPKRLLDAKTYVERGEVMLPLIKKDRDETKRELAEVKRTLKQFADFASKAEERAYQRAVADLEAKHAEAVETGDVKAAAAVVKQMRDLDKPEPKPDEKPDVAQMNREFAQWVEDNDWYVTDERKRAYADIMAQGMGPAGEYEGGPKKWLDDLRSKVERKFTTKPNPVNAGGNREGASPGGRTYSDLPAAAKAMCDRFVKTIPGFSKEQYLKDYEWG